MARSRPALTRRRLRWSLVAGTGALALVASACSSSSTPSAGSGDPSPFRTHHTSFGTVLTDASGRSVYLFEADTGTTSTCYTDCAGLWPPVTMSGSPSAQPPVQGSLLRTTPRRDGGTQVTYAGHPLYYYAPDQSPGDAKGQGLQSFGAGWDLLKPSGVKVDGGGA
jgi:predicted lipoprotein with Yx(FWY)xxD motif